MNSPADVLNGRIPVSYTHLDVYKRQLQEYLNAMVIFVEGYV